MGLLSRLKEISTGKLLAFLDEATHPDQLIPSLLQELQTQHGALKNAEAKSFAVVRSAQKELEATLGRAVRMERGAALALAKGDEQTARDALREQLRIEKGVPALQERVAKAQQILDDTRDQQSALASQIESVKARGEQVRLQLQLQKLSPAPAAESHLLRKVAQMEERLAEETSQNEARREIRNRRSLDERLLELERNDEIARRLHELKNTSNKEK